MQDNPYRSPEEPRENPRENPRTLNSPRAVARDRMFVGAVLGGTIGAATGTATAVCLLGWIALTNIGASTPNPSNLTTVERLIAMVVAPIVLGSMDGAAAGALLGALLGLLAERVRFRNSHSLTAIATVASAGTAVLCVGLLWGALRWQGIGHDRTFWTALLAIAIVTSGLGGAVLGRRLGTVRSPGSMS